MDDLDAVFAEDDLPDDPPTGRASQDRDRDDGEPEPEPEPEFTSVYNFVEEHLRFIYARKLRMKNERTWCPRWFEHAEAVSRLEALWRAYEVLRLEPGTGMSVWWRDHADHHMRMLMAVDGPFEGCTVEGGHVGDTEVVPLPVEEMSDLAVRQAMSINPRGDTDG